MVIIRYFLLLLFISVTSGAFAQWTYKDFNRLRNITGNWEMKTEKGFLQEKWERPNDTTFKGRSYKIDRGVSILDEKMTIVFSNKEIIFSASVQYQNKGLPVSFKLIKIDGGKYIFENKEHDFPTQVIYQIKNANKLLAWINGTTEKGFKTISFEFYSILK